MTKFKKGEVVRLKAPWWAWLDRELIVEKVKVVDISHRSIFGKQMYILAPLDDLEDTARLSEAWIEKIKFGR